MERQRTIDDYKEAGAWMRLLKAVLTSTYVSCSKVARVKEYENPLWSAEKKIEQVCSRAEDNMFGDFPELSNEYIDVFYGAPDSHCRNDVDSEQVELMIKLVKELFKDNWK